MRPEKICLLVDLGSVGTMLLPDMEFIAGLYVAGAVPIAFSIMLISFMASFQFYK